MPFACYVSRPSYKKPMQFGTGGESGQSIYPSARGQAAGYPRFGAPVVTWQCLIPDRRTRNVKKITILAALHYSGSSDAGWVRPRPTCSIKSGETPLPLAIPMPWPSTSCTVPPIFPSAPPTWLAPGCWTPGPPRLSLLKRSAISGNASGKRGLSYEWKGAGSIASGQRPEGYFRQRNE